MLIDLHVHTSRYSSCGNSTPEEMAAAAIESGLDGIVFTEHNVMWPQNEIEALRGQFAELTIFNGIELTSDEGDDYLVMGIADQDWFAPRLPAEMLTRRAQALGGVVILAHPYRYRPEVPETLWTAPVDGVEVASCNMHGAASEDAERLAAALGAWKVWDSDAHHITTVGLYGNDLAASLSSESELARALRRGTHRPYADEQRIRLFNQELHQHMAVILRLIAEGASNEDIRAQLPILVRYSDLYAIRSALSVWRPIPLAEPQAIAGSE